MEKCPAQTFFFVNEDFIDFYALPMANTTPANYKSVDIKGNDYSSVKGLGFSFDEFIKPINQAALISHIYLAGNMISTRPRSSGKLTGLLTS